MDNPTASPFTPDYHALRIRQGRDLLSALGLDALVAYSAPRGLASATRTSGNVGWFTGFTPMWAPCLLVLTQVRAVLVAPGKNEVRLFSTRVGDAFEVVGPGTEGIVGTALGLLGSRSAAVGTAGMDELPLRLAVQLAAGLQRTVGIDAHLHELRLRRDPIEVDLHRRASEISDRMVERAFEYAATPGAAPARLMAEVEHEGRSRGADISRLWLAAGPRPRVTHFEMFELPSSLDLGDRVQLGTMVSFEGYFAQGLRIGSLGRPAPALRDAVDRICAIQDEALELIRPGEPVHRLVDQIEARIDTICPYGRDTDPFRFQSCHGLGLDYSEPGLSEALSPQRDRSCDAERPTFRPGMVLEIHPNFTLPELGHVCAGDVALVTETGAEWLTHTPRGVRALS